ncbi:TIGR04222 domain-containing membrane protein [Streptomyces sp. NPDC007971]|uniref:TIGR04222 domain-containing membrane protein n=1 Tax=Streptomyces sp. NPDC007971 TaxID=3364799 RepID=UPI0036E4E12C
MAGTTRIPTEAHALALLRAGNRAAVTVAVLDLHLRGAVRAGRAGTLRTSGPAPGVPLPALTKAVRASLYRPAGMGQLLDRHGVRAALGALREDLVAAGLLRSVLPGRTRAGRRALKRLRARNPLPTAPAGLSDGDKLLLVALHGDRALTLLVPRFTREAGLTGRGGTTERGLRQSWAGGGSDGGFTCGVV